jgi:hypothetical protein
VRVIGLAAAVILLLGLAACGRSSARDDVRAVTERFFAAVESGDGETACEQLSPNTRAELESQEQQDCREAITELQLEGGTVSSLDVFALNAVVELSNGEIAYVDDGAEGWRLSAVGCTPQEKPPDRPADCELKS